MKKSFLSRTVTQDILKSFSQYCASFFANRKCLKFAHNVQEEDGKSLLVAAVELRQPQFVSVLLRAGASPNVYNQVHDSDWST
jgi:hypothetical protein